MLSKIAGVLCACMGLSISLSASTVKVSGSSTLSPIVREALKDFRKDNPEVKVVLGGGGSGGGITGVEKGEIGIGLSSRKINDLEKDRSSLLREEPICWDGIAIIVHGSNEIEEVTKTQVHKIYTGQISNWKELGGPDKEIEVIGHSLIHGTSDIFLEYFGLKGKNEGKVLKYTASDENSSTGAAIDVDGSRAAAASVVRSPYAISFASVGVARNIVAMGASVKLLKLDGILASNETVKQGIYPLSRPLQIITQGEVDGDTKKLFDYLRGPKVQEIAKNQGFIPLGN